MATPPDAALSRLGMIRGAGSDRATFLRLGALEVLDAFETATVFKGKTRQRNIKGGSSVKFPITGKMKARYHAAGTPILGEGNSPSDLNERIIELDSLMIADVAVQEVDELMNYYDVRSIYTKELGRALAYEYDRRAARMIYAAAINTTEPLALAQNTGRAGHVIDLPTTFSNKEAHGDVLVDAIFDARIALAAKDVSVEGMCGVFPPEEYFAIVNSKKAINVDFGNAGNGSIAKGNVAMVADIPIYMSNHVNQPAYVNVTGDKNPAYAQDLSTCRGLIFHQEAIGILTLMEPGLQMTSGDWNISHQATLMVARQAIGMGVLRAEAAVALVDDRTP
jgi:hypothetical protein